MQITVLGFSGTDDIVLLETIQYINTTSNENDTAVELRTNAKTIINQNKRNNCNETTESDAKDISILRIINLNELARNNTNVDNANGVDTQDFNEDTNGNSDVKLDENNNQHGNNSQDGEIMLDGFNDLDGENNGDDINEDGDGNQNGDDNQGGNDNQEGNGQNQIDRNKDTTTDASFWNTWTITLVAVGSATVVALLCVGSYYIGKIRGNNKVSSEEIIEEDIEAPRVIPRVKRVYDAPTRLFSSLSNSNLRQDTLSMW